MKGKHFAVTEKNKKRTKSIVLSIVALLELILIVTSMTFSWFEGLTSLELEGDGFRTASVLNSHIEVGENKTSSDNTYNSVIDLTTFYDTQNEVRFSPVSSADATTFYAPYEGEAGSESAKYRELSTSEVNSDILQFSFNLSAPHGATDFYFTETLPIVNTDWENTYENRESSPFRFAFSDGTTTLIFRNSTEMDTTSALANNNQKAISSLNSDNTANTVTGTLSRPQEYAYYTDHRDEVEAPDPSGVPIDVAIKPIFHLNKGQTKTITVSIWLEAFDYECLNESEGYAPQAGSSVSFDIKLCSSWSINRKITVYDYTAEQWIDTADSENRTTALFARNADGDSDNRQYQFTYNSTDKFWTGTIPLALQNCEFLWGTIQNGKCNPSQTWNKFKAPNRNNSNTLTILGLDSACVWGLGPADLEKIDFADYTDGSWIANKDDLGNDISMNVSIVYDGRILDYSMTGSPTTGSFGKNTWSCWIPKKVNSVDFSRRGYNSQNVLTEFNIWYGTDRNGETLYRALTGSSGTTDTSKFYLYVTVSDEIADIFYADNVTPAISYTSDSNRTLWERTSEKSTISRYDYVPRNDIWPNGESELTRIGTSNTWFMAFDERPTDGTYVTVWSRSGANNFNDVDTNMSFGVFYLFEANKNYTTINLTTAQALTSKDASNNYALLGTMDSSGTGAGGNVNSEGNIGTGKWGTPDAPAEGSYDSYFVHTGNVDMVYLTFTYDSEEWTMKMEKDTTDSTGRTWKSKAMPNTGVTNIKFTDSNGKTWTDPGTATRTSGRCYFYAKDTNGNSTGWTRQLKTTNDYVTYYFKHFTTSATTVTVSYLKSGVPFSFTMTKENNQTWYTYNLPDDATDVTFEDNLNNKWSNTSGHNADDYYYFATENGKGMWAAPKTYRVGIIYYLTKNQPSQSGRYVSTVRYWNNDGLSGDVYLPDLAYTTKSYRFGSGYWSNAAQTCYCYEFVLPDSITGIKFWDKDNNKWYGNDVTSFANNTINIIFEYSGNYHNVNKTY